METLLGKYCSHLNFAQLSNVKQSANLYNRTANIVDDTNQPKNFDLARIQSIISGGTIQAEPKGDSEFTFAPYSTLLIATTNVLDFKDFNKSLTRRLKVVPFHANFDTSANFDMAEEICQPEKLNVIATMALQAFHKVLEDKYFHIPSIVEETTMSYFFESNPVMEFVSLNPIQSLVSKHDYHHDFLTWAANNHREELGVVPFGKKVLSLGYKTGRYTFNKKRDTYYTAPDFNIAKWELQYKEYCNNSNSSADESMDFLTYIKSFDKKD